MTRLLTCGYETGDANEAGVTVLTSGTVTVVNAAPAPRAGNYCLKLTSSVNSPAALYKSFALGSAKTEVWVRFAFIAHYAGTPVEVAILAFLDSAAGSQAGLTYSGDGLLRLYRGAPGSTIIGTASAGFSQDTWHVVEVRQQMTSTTVGVSEVWLDGTRVINFSGDNTGTTNVNVQSLILGISATASNATVNTYLAYDDIAINDVAGTVNNGRPGDGRVVLLVPNGAGSSTQLTRGGTDSGANWDQVNEVPPSLTDYVFGSTVGNRDLYAMSDLPVAVQSINVVEAIALAQNSDAGAGSIGLTIKSGATTNEATAVTLSTSALYAVSRWETDPATSTAWTAAGVNALEAGATVR